MARMDEGRERKKIANSDEEFAISGDCAVRAEGLEPYRDDTKLS